MTMESQITSLGNLLWYRGAIQGDVPQLALRYGLDYTTLGVSLAGSLHYVPVVYEWGGDALDSAQPRQVAFTVPLVLTAGCNSPGNNITREFSGVDATRPMMHQSLLPKRTAQICCQQVP